MDYSKIGTAEDDARSAPAPKYVGVKTDADRPIGDGSEQSPGLVRSFLQGVAEAPGGMARTLDAGSRWIGERTGLEPGGGFGMLADALDEKLQQPFIAATGRGFVHPQTPGEEHAAAIGRGLGTFATYPAGGVSGLVSSLMGAIAGEAAKEAGLPWYGQLLAGIAGSASPSVLGMAVPRLPGVPAVTGRVGRAMSSRMREDAVRLGAASTLRGNVGDVTRGAHLLDAEALGVNGPGLASTAQVLRTEAPGLVGLEGGLVKTSTAGLGERLAARRAASARQIDDAYAQALPGSPGTVAGGFRAALARSRDRYHSLYAGIDDASVGPVAMADIKQEAQDIASRFAAHGRDKIPARAQELLDAPDTYTFSQLRDLRTSLTDDVRSARATVQREGKNAQLLANTERLLSRVDDAIDGLEASGVPAAGQLRAANAAYREHQDIFGRAHPTVRKLLDAEDPSDAIAKILGRGVERPAEEARRLVRGLSADPDSLEGLRRMTADELLWGASGNAAKAGGVSPSAVSGARLGARLTENEPALRVLMGDDQYDMLRRLAARIDTTTYGRAGTPGYYLSTGSALKDAEQQATAGAETAAEMMGAILNPAGALAKKGAKMAHEWLMDKATLAQQRQLLEDAMVDPKIARDLLLDVTPERFSAWKERMNANLSRSAARAGMSQPRSTE